MAFSVVGCGTRNDETNTSQNTGINETNTPQDTAASETITIKDARGEVDIPKNPQKIVDISGFSDILSIIGYNVIGTANSDAYDYTKFPTYLEDIFEGVKILGYSMQSTMDIESIISLEPDLIIISNVQEKMYDQLSSIAPTVMIEMEQTDWAQDLQNVASIFGKEDIAKEWLDSYYEKARQIGNSIKEKYSNDKTYLSILASGGQIFVFDAAGFGSFLYEDLGLAKPENMPEQENISLPVVSYEGLAQINPDYIFAVVTEEDKAQLESNAIWQNIEAVKEGNYLFLPSSPYFNQTYSPIGRLLLLDEIEGLMSELEK
ncbi:MAG: ABC transporter substrate-binding protein [Eubacteriales bacterium]|nr:ABC transporter substrate-binding protein [Eubacteriales bacterium]